MKSMRPSAAIFFMTYYTGPGGGGRVKEEPLLEVRILLECILVQTLIPPTNELWSKVIFLHLSVILFTGGSTWAGIPPGRYTPPRQVHSPGRYTPSAMHAGVRSTSGWAVRILPECILILTFLAPKRRFKEVYTWI